MEENRDLLDQIGRYVGYIRQCTGVALNDLAYGVCTPAYLLRVEAGERGMNKVSSDALLQRLGQPIENFLCILDEKDYFLWQCRMSIQNALYRGDTKIMWREIDAYPITTCLERQFFRTIHLNCLALDGAPPEELYPLCIEALQLTQPRLEEHHITALSRLEGHLLLAALELRERIAGPEAAEAGYHFLMEFLCQDRYDVRERSYLLGYVTLHMIEAAFRREHLSAALALCENVLAEQSQENRLQNHRQLLEWKLRLTDAMGMDTREPAAQLRWLSVLQSKAPKGPRLLVPYREQGYACCLNRLLRERRALLGISQEEAAFGVCDTSTVSRIENRGHSPKRRVRLGLLKKVNMSGQLYDYEVVMGRAEDYRLRSELSRASGRGDYAQAALILEQLRKNVRKNRTSLQYLEMEECNLRGHLPKDDPCWLSPEQRETLLRKTLSRTIPRDVDDISSWPICSLAINEVLLLLNIAKCHKRTQPEKALSIAVYLTRCMEKAGSAFMNFDQDSVGRLLISCLGDCGRYVESDELASAYVKAELEAERNFKIPFFLFNLAWNLWQHEKTADPKYQPSKKVIALFQEAYAAALFNNDVSGQKYIPKYCQEHLGIELVL